MAWIPFFFKWDFNPITQILVTTKIWAIIEPLGGAILSCWSLLCPINVPVGEKYWLPLSFSNLHSSSGIMKSSPQTWDFQVRSCSILPNPLFKVCSIFSNWDLFPSLGRQTTAIADIIYGSCFDSHDVQLKYRFFFWEFFLILRNILIHWNWESAY